MWWPVSAPLSTQSSSVGGSSSSRGRPGRRRCRAAYAVIRQLAADDDDGEEQSRVVTACPGEARRTVYQLYGNNFEMSIVGSKTMISSTALLLRFDGQYIHWPPKTSPLYYGEWRQSKFSLFGKGSAYRSRDIVYVFFC